MSSLVLGVVGGVVGFYFGGPQGAQLGFLAGSALGGAIDAPTTPATRIGDLSVQASTYGVAMPYGYGSMRVAGNVIFCTDKREVITEDQAGKGGPTVETASYNVDIAIDLVGGPIVGISKIWMNGELIYDSSTGASIETLIASSAKSRSFRVYLGTEDQMPDSVLEADLGVGRVPAYRGRAYVVLEQLDCPGAQIPQLSFEVVVHGQVGSEAQPISMTGMAPFGEGAGGYITEDGEFQATRARSGEVIARTDLTTHGLAADGTRLINTQSVPGWTSFPQSSGQDLPGMLLSGNGLVPAFAGILQFVGGEVSQSFDYLGLNTGGGTGVRGYVYQDGVLVGFLPGNGKVLIAEASSTAVTPPGVPECAVVTTDRVWVFGSAYMVGTDLWAREYDRASLAVISTDHWPPGTAGRPQTFGFCVTYVGDGSAWLADTFYFRELFRFDAGVWTYSGSIDGVGVYAACALRVKYPMVQIGQSSVRDDNTMITFNMEAVTQATPPVAEIIVDQCVRAGLAPGQIDVAAVTAELQGYPISRVTSGRSNIDPLMAGYYLAYTEANGKVKFVSRTDGTIAATIPYDELAAGEGDGAPGDPLALERTQESELPRSLTVNFINVAADYQTGSEVAQRQTTNSLSDTTQDFAVVTTADHAANVAQNLLYDAWTRRNAWTARVSRRYAGLSSADKVLVEWPRGVTRRYELVRVNDTGVLVELSLIESDIELFASTAKGGSPDIEQTVPPLPAMTLMEVLDIPILQDADNDPGLYVAMGARGTAWRGADLYTGPTASSLSAAGTVLNRASIGIALTVLPNSDGENFFDTEHSVTVTASGPLFNATHDQVLFQGVNACVLGNEILQYLTATDLGNSTYLLSGLLRGRCGTEWARGIHAANERFVTLQLAGMLRPQAQAADIGASRVYQAITIGRDASSATTKTATNTAVGLRPYSPTNLRATRLADGGVQFTWNRRTRLANNWLVGVVPLGEASEAYRLTVGARVLDATTRTVTYTLAQQFADLGHAWTTGSVSVAQVSATVGPGTPATATLTVDGFAGSPVIPPDGSGGGTGGSGGVTDPAGNPVPILYGVGNLAYEQTTAGGSVVRQVLETTDGGASYTALGGAGALVNEDPRYNAVLSSGLYVSLNDGDVTVGSPGVGPAVTAGVFASPYMPVGVGSDGSKFIVLTTGNRVYTSTNGTAWTLSGTATIPLVYTGTGESTNYGGGAAITWAAGRWFATFTTGRLYYTTDAAGVTGWTLATLPANSLYQHNRMVSFGGNLYAAGIGNLDTVGSAIVLKSTDSGSTWTRAYDTATVRASDVFALGSKLVVVGFDYVGKTYDSSDGSTWVAHANSQSYVLDVDAAGSGVVALVPRAGATAGQPSNRLRYSADGITFADSAGV